MAKVHKVSFYLTDWEEVGEEDSTEYIKNEIECLLDSFDYYITEMVEVKSSKSFEWENELKINMDDATKEDFEKYFEGDSTVIEKLKDCMENCEPRVYGKICNDREKEAFKLALDYAIKLLGERDE